MNKVINNRIKRLERKAGTGDGFKRYLASISNLHGGLPPAPTPPISPAKQEEIDKAFALLSEEELSILADICAG